MRNIITSLEKISCLQATLILLNSVAAICLWISVWVMLQGTFIVILAGIISLISTMICCVSVEKIKEWPCLNNMNDVIQQVIIWGCILPLSFTSFYFILYLLCQYTFQTVTLLLTAMFLSSNLYYRSCHNNQKSLV